MEESWLYGMDIKVRTLQYYTYVGNTEKHTLSVFRVSIVLSYHTLDL